MHGGPRSGLLGTVPPGFPPLPNPGAVESSRSGVDLGVRADQAKPKKTKKGRPRGSGRRDWSASSPSASVRKRGRGEWIVGLAGIDFTPHVITIAVGEDISERIMSFSQQGPRAVCILSANGAVSTVTLHQPGTSGVMVTYEGLFEILCLSGLYMPTDNGRSHSRSSWLSISLSSPYGRVIGGRISGLLIAAKPVQLIVGSFTYAGSSAKNKTVTGQGAGDVSEHQIRDKQRTVFSTPQNQNITSNMVEGITSLRQLDMS